MERQQQREQALFPSFFGAGFESAYHHRPDGKRVDSVAATQHDTFVFQDYQRLADAGLLVARENVRWYLFEPAPGRYEPQELLRTVRAAAETGITCIWDLFHYGWPDGLDFWSEEMVERAGAYAGAVARCLRDAGIERPFLAPANEINYFAWAGGDKGLMNPFARDRAPEAKRQLVRCAVAMCRAIREVLPQARLAHTDPLIYLVANSPEEEEKTRKRNICVYEGWDMLSGRAEPELGGSPDLLDIIGVNYYANNQLLLDGPELAGDDARRRSFASLLREVWERYERPLFVSETAEAGDRRAPWLAQITEECVRAIRAGVQVEGITLYPILDYPEWQSGEPMLMGLWGEADNQGRRPVYAPLLDELHRQQAKIADILGGATNKNQALLQPA